MVELMLMQNAQMHQIIMHNMMLKAIPPMALSPASGHPPATPHSAPTDVYSRARGSAVHHHHHYGPSLRQLPPISYPMWGSQAGAVQPSIQHVMGPISLPPLSTGHRWS
ncbi:uncharacterized protein C21orf58-like [Engraulis encrasicolus]|uniref:uncharacterized protein C21orf58-like n=1 Tax=Engraulis encrasicolus TaxID=184585 RepID=UPI002FD287B2